MNIFQSLAKLANTLDQRGLTKEANLIDGILVKMAEDPNPALNARKEALIEKLVPIINSKSSSTFDTHQGHSIMSYRARIGKDNNYIISDEPVLLIGFSYKSPYQDLKSRERLVKTIMAELSSTVDKAGFEYTVSYRPVDTSTIADYLGGIQDLVPPKDAPDLMNLFVVNFDRIGGDPGVVETLSGKVTGLFGR
jgi:hypothetical protein